MSGGRGKQHLWAETQIFKRPLKIPVILRSPAALISATILHWDVDITDDKAGDTSSRK